MISKAICGNSMTSRFLTAPSAGSRDKILPIVKEWQERPLEEIYAVVFMVLSITISQ